jgi:hypothetical protein
MILIVTHNYVHRHLRGGIVQSAPLHEDGGIYSVKEDEFAIFDPSAMGMTGGDSEEVRHSLMRLNQIFEKNYRLPTSEKATQAAVSGAQVQ